MPNTVLYLDHTAKMSGGEISLLRLLKSIDRDFVMPVVLLAEDGPLVQALKDAGIETHILPLSKEAREVRKDSLTFSGIFKRLGAIFRVLLYAFAVAKWAKNRRVDVIHTNSLKADIYGALAARFAKVPVVWHVRDRIDVDYLPRIMVMAFRCLARLLPNHIITNSHSTLETLCLPDVRSKASDPNDGRSDSLNNRFSVVHNGLGDDEMREVKQSGTFSDSEPAFLRIGIVGRLAPWKGQHIFLDAAASLAVQNDGSGRTLEFVIIGAPLFGEQSYEQQLRDQAQQLGIAPQVKFLGFRQDVRSELRRLDILVHASISPEPFGQVVLEGMAMGLPVVATNAGGVCEIITDQKTGILVPMGDARTLASALTELVTDSSRRAVLGKAAHDHVCLHFRSRHTAQAVERIYGQMLQKTRQVIQEETNPSTAAIG